MHNAGVRDKPASIALCMIIKDDSEAKMLQRCLESFTPFTDGLYVAVTGPSGKHKKIHKIVKSFNGKSISTSPETHPQIYHEGKFADFAEARNVSFDMVDKDYDWLLWADADDVLIGGEEMLEIAGKAIDKKYDSVFFTYWYAVRLSKDGNIEQVIVEHLRERLLKPNVFKWVSKLHEVAVPKDGNYRAKQTMYKYNQSEGHLCAWVHLTTEERTKKTMERNKLILELQYSREEGKDPRTLFYLAKVHFDLDELEESEDYLKRYLELSGWDAERANALEYLGLIYTKKGNHRKSVETYHKSIAEYPRMHLPYLRLASSYFNLGMDEHAIHWLEVAINLPPPEAETTIGSTFEIKLLATTLKYMQAQRENNINEMAKWAEIRENLIGENDGLLEDVLWHKNLNIAAMGVFNYAKWLKDNGELKSILPLLDSLPEALQDEPFVRVIANDVLPPKKWGDKSIVYFASFGTPHFEKWGAGSLKKGIGGSETAVIELSKEWAKQGYEVTVYCDCDEKGTFEGVTYKPYSLFNFKDEFNVLILWRSPHLLDTDIKAKRLLMDMHDVMSPLDWTEDRVKKVDKIMVKSQYHRNNLRKIDDSKFTIISNGIRA